jgi:hypothetical protein
LSSSVQWVSICYSSPSLSSQVNTQTHNHHDFSKFSPFPSNPLCGLSFFGPRRGSFHFLQEPPRPTGLTRFKSAMTHFKPTSKPISNAKNPFLMPQKSFLML